MPIRNKRLFKKQRGATAVEFALILVPLMALIFAFFEFGIVFNNWIALNYAAREGVRLAAVDEYDEAKVRERAPSVKIDSITVNPLHGEIGSPVTVTVIGKPVDLNFLALSKIVVLSSSATLRIENR